MAVKIIEKHNNHRVFYQHTCRKCGTIFEFQREDCSTTYDRSSAILSIHCPVCGQWTDGTDQWKVIYRTSD